MEKLRNNLGQIINWGTFKKNNDVKKEIILFHFRVWLQGDFEKSFSLSLEANRKVATGVFLNKCF